MKKFKKLVALILVGVMAMAMLTACGGGGGSSAGPSNSQMEDLIVSAVNGARSKGSPALTNNAGMKSKASEALNHINNGMIAVKYAYQIDIGASSANGSAYMQAIVIPTVEDDIKNYLENALVTPEAMTMDTARKYASNLGRVEGDEDQEMLDEIKAIGVATKTIDGKTYMAVAIRWEETA